MTCPEFALLVATAGAPAPEAEVLIDDLIEEVSIDGMCGVY